MKIAIVRIRGVRKLKPDIKKTLELLRLEKPNHCVLVDGTPQTLGMINVVKDYVAYGEVDEEMVFRLLLNKGRKGTQMLKTTMKEADIKKMAGEIHNGKKTVEFANPVFRLRPPSKGYKSIRLPYPEGDLGKRPDMAPLLRRMI